MHCAQTKYGNERKKTRNKFANVLDVLIDLANKEGRNNLLLLQTNVFEFVIVEMAACCRGLKAAKTGFGTRF